MHPFSTPWKHQKIYGTNDDLIIINDLILDATKQQIPI